MVDRYASRMFYCPLLSVSFVIPSASSRIPSASSGIASSLLPFSCPPSLPPSLPPLLPDRVSLEILVVDDGSVDQTRAIVEVRREGRREEEIDRVKASFNQIRIST